MTMPSDLEQASMGMLIRTTQLHRSVEKALSEYRIELVEIVRSGLYSQYLRENHLEKDDCRNDPAKVKVSFEQWLDGKHMFNGVVTYFANSMANINEMIQALYAGDVELLASDVLVRCVQCYGMRPGAMTYGSFGWAHHPCGVINDVEFALCAVEE